MTPRIRTILIDDSSFMRKVISDIINEDSELELIGTASNGKEGSSLAIDLRPDVVITDMVMPQYDGMYVIDTLMENYPVPVIILSSLEKTNNKIFDALQHGAFEFIDKPVDLSTRAFKNYPLCNLIKEAARTDISLLKSKQLSQHNTSAHTFEATLNYDIIVLGSSTGGPGAIEQIITNLPDNLKVPVVIAQHMPTRFLETFAIRLNEQSQLKVKVAEDGEIVKGGVVYIAPGHINTRINRNSKNGQAIIQFTAKRYQAFNHPSVNCLFESIADAYGARCIGVILTGMGCDGAEGLLKIKRSGGYTIAQDELSCIVYGMPKVAKEHGAVKQVVPLSEMAGFITSCL